MAVNKNYSSLDRKIFNNWNDIKKLIALENKLLTKLDYLENRINEMWKRISEITE